MSREDKEGDVAIPRTNSEQGEHFTYEVEDFEEDSLHFGSEKHDLSLTPKKMPLPKTPIKIDVKPWSKDSDMDAVLTAVKNIAMVGILWGTHEFVPGDNGMTLLKINCELDLIKVSEDEILEKINDLIDFVMAAEISSYMLNVINKI